MKPFRLTQAALALIVGALLHTLAPTPANAQVSEFCWRDTKTRGAGTIPTTCPSGTVQDPTGLLCYPSCRSGYYMVGPVCWQSCPAGYIDMGATCHINKALTTSGTWECTERDYFGTCWWSVLRCPSGYTNAGLFCALTTPAVPPGMSGSGLDPMKGSYGNGAGRIKNGCPSGKENDAGLCYTTCGAGTSGVGPVCWSRGPSGWVECGMGSAKTSTVCGTVVFGQVTSVGNLALTVATAGSSTVATAGAGAATDAAKLSSLRQKYKLMKDAYEAAKPAIDAAITAKKAAGTTVHAVNLVSETNVTAEDIARISAEIAAIADPTGVADVVAAYTYPKCSALKLP